MINSYDEEKIETYLDQLYNRDSNGFRFYRQGPCTILSSAFGVQLAYLLGMIARYPGQQIGDLFLQCQKENDGVFVDPEFKKEDLDGFEPEYILWQFTYFATIALDMLGLSPLQPFKFLQSLKKTDRLNDWLVRQNYTNFWYTSNKFMFLFYFLTYEQSRRGIDNSQPIKQLFDFLDQHQDPSSGFWGTDVGATVMNGMFGAAHIYLFYNYFQRPIKYRERIIDNTLSLSDKRGLYGSQFGGACEEYDAVEVFSMVTKDCSWRRTDIEDILCRTYQTIISCQGRHGGFPYAVDTRTLIRKIKDIIKRRSYCYKYSSWKKMESKKFRPDIWGTYFRLLSLAKIESMLGEASPIEYRFYDLPGWGYQAR